jgi:hypothetical protein
MSKKERNPGPLGEKPEAPPSPPAPYVGRSGPRRGGLKPKPTTPKPDVTPPGQRPKRYARARADGRASDW